MLAALGVVYGDIGTSPLDTIRETFHSHFGLTPTVTNVPGILSLVFWSIVLVVVVKYLVFILRADNPTGLSASRCWAPCFLPSGDPRRFTLTSDTSERSPFGWHSFPSHFPHFY